MHLDRANGVTTNKPEDSPGHSEKIHVHHCEKRIPVPVGQDIEIFSADIKVHESGVRIVNKCSQMKPRHVLVQSLTRT